MMSAVVTAAAAGVVLAAGTQDARLLRLGLVAALWAALLAAFAAAQMRREACSTADHADRLRSLYQLELEREVTARREHALTVERELREQAEFTQRREIVELHAELAAMRADLEHLGGAPLVERVTLRAESTRLRPLPVNASPTSAQVVPVARSGTEARFGPDLAPISHSEVFGGGSSQEQGRHGMAVQEWPDSPTYGAGPHTNGSSALQSRDRTPPAPAVQGQRTVDDLIAAHGGIVPTARRRRNHT
jgi:hypothetical protein